jgi:hypothetical protein
LMEALPKGTILRMAVGVKNHPVPYTIRTPELPKNQGASRVLWKQSHEAVWSV